MKLHHYSIIFVIISLTLFFITDSKIQYISIIKGEKIELDQSFQCAVDNGVLHLVEQDGIAGLTINKERAVTDFFTSLYASLGIMDDVEKQEFLKNYVPIIAVTCEDGYYLYFSDEYVGRDPYTHISKRWSEKVPYTYEDTDFVYGFTLTDIITLYDKNRLLDPNGEQKIFTLDYHELQQNELYSYFRTKRPDSFLLNDNAFYLRRKGYILSAIEESMVYHCNLHNNIARQFGITYNFAMPVTDTSEWMRTIDNPSMLVVFQGYPLIDGGSSTYNRFAFAGARIKKKEVYYLEQKAWYYLYHKKECESLQKEGIFFLNEPLYTVLDCAKRGAYACPICTDRKGVHVPDYIP